MAILDLKLERADLKTDRNWVPRMRELAGSLFRQDPSIAENTVVLISGRDGQAFLFDELPVALQRPASGVFAAKVRADWEQATPNQLRVAALSGEADSIDLFRQAANYDHLREAAILALAIDPNAADRDLFVQGLRSRNNTLVRYSAIALQRVADKPDPEEQLAALKAASQLGWSGEEFKVRDQLIRLLRQQTNQDFGYQFGQYGRKQSHSLDLWQDFLRSRYGERFGELFSTETSYELSDRLGQINWDRGDISTGKEIYQKLNCRQCHDDRSSLGPRLEGITKRFSREDLFHSIVMPSQQIPDRYRAIIVETKDGLVYHGTIIYESVDGITLQDAEGETIRINQAEIETRAESKKSLMPDGLLDQIESSQWADLYAYMTTL